MGPGTDESVHFSTISRIRGHYPPTDGSGWLQGSRRLL